MENDKTDPAAPNVASAAALPPPPTGGATSAPTLPASPGAVHCPYRRTVDLLQRMVRCGNGRVAECRVIDALAKSN